jgi:hypothetical protein
MSKAHPPVTVYFGPLGALRRRLLEAGIDFRAVETPPAGQPRRHRIPVAGNQAFWFEPR